MKRNYFSFDEAGPRVTPKEHVAVRVGPSSKPQVLVVGSNTLDVTLLDLVLSGSGMQVQVMSAEDVGRVDIKTPVDAIVLDRADCGPSTIALIKRLRERSACKYVPIVVATQAGAAWAMGREFASLGVRWVLKKPIAAASFPKLVLKTIGESKTLDVSRMGNTAFVMNRVAVLDMGQSVSSVDMASVR